MLLHEGEISALYSGGCFFRRIFFHWSSTVQRAVWMVGTLGHFWFRLRLR